MGFLSFFLVCATVLRNVSYLDIQQGDIKTADIIIENECIKRITSPNRARVGSKDFLIDATGYYLMPSIIDLGIFKNGNPGGNIWVNEFSEEIRTKNEAALQYYGVYTIGVMGAVKDTSTNLDIYTIGPWVRIPSSSAITPYGFEEWNPYIFDVYNLKTVEDVATLIDSIIKTRPVGVILALPKDANISEKELILLKELRKQLTKNNFLLFGINYSAIENRILDIIKPDVLIGWLPEAIHNGVRYEMPLFLEQISLPEKLIPYSYRQSLHIPYAFPKVGISIKSKELVHNLTKHNLKVLKKRSPKNILLGSMSGFAQIFFGHGTLNSMNKLVEAGFSRLEVIRIATLYASDFLGKKKNGIYEGNEASFSILKDNPLDNLNVLAKPITLFKKGTLIMPDHVLFQVDSLHFSPLLYGKSLLITNFKKDVTTWGTVWNESPLSFGLDGRWEKNCLVGKKAKSFDEKWMKGGVINLESDLATGWDLSPYASLQLEFEKVNTPCSLFLLNKAAYTTESPRVLITPNLSKISMPLTEPYSRFVQGLLIKPLSIGKGEYRISLKKLILIAGEDFEAKLLDNLWKRVELGVFLGDTSFLWETRAQMSLVLKVHPSSKIRFLYGYVNYRLATIMKEDSRKGKLIDEAIKMLSKDEGIEIRILEYALLGIQAGLNPLKAIFSGRRLNKIADHLLQEGKTNPRAHLVLGLSKLFTPSMFGGSIEKSIDHFQESISLYKCEQQILSFNNWGYADAFVFLSEAYKKSGQRSEARKILEELMTLFPYYIYGKIKLLSL